MDDKGEWTRQAIDIMTVVNHVFLRCKRTHAVAQQNERLVGVFCLDDLTKAKHVFYQQLKSACSEISTLLG